MNVPEGKVGAKKSLRVVGAFFGIQKDHPHSTLGIFSELDALDVVGVQAS